MSNATHVVQSTEVDAALCRCVLYEALSVGLYTPSRESVARLRSNETREALADAARRLESYRSTAGSRSPRDPRTDAAPDRNPPRLVKRVDALTTCLEGNLDLGDLQAAYGRLFGHTARGAVCPYESEFGTETHFQQTARLADLGGFYAAFGLKLSEHTNERIDHVCSELEFLGFLARKEAFALQEHDDAMLAETRKAVRLFLRNHLGRFARAFARELSREDRGGFYGRLAEVLFDFVTLECALAGVAAGPVFVTLRPTEDADDALECGGGCDPTACEVPGPSEGAL